MSRQGRHFYTFGPFRLDVGERLLLRDHTPVPLAPKDFEVLLILVRNGGSLVDKEQFLREIWPDTFIEESNLNVHIFNLRRALSDANGTRFIETVPRRGFRFLPPVQEGRPAGVSTAPCEMTPQISLPHRTFAKSEAFPDIGASQSTPHPPSALDTLGAGAGSRSRAATRKPRVTLLRWKRAISSAVAVLVASVSAFLFWYSKGAPRGQEWTPEYVPLTALPGNESAPSFSPWGDRIAFLWTESEHQPPKVYVKLLGSFGDAPLQLTKGTGFRLFSGLVSGRPYDRLLSQLCR